MRYMVEPGSEGLRLDLEALDEVDLRLVGGEVSLAGTSSPSRLEVDGVTGEPALDGVAGRLRVESVSGPVTVVGGLLQELLIGTVTGEVVADLDPRPGARCSCHTASGPVTVRLPADASVAFEAESLSGHIDVPDWAETSEDEVPPWARGWSGTARAWSETAQAWAG